MKRRSFIEKASIGLMGLGMRYKVPIIQKKIEEKKPFQNFVTLENNRINLYSKSITEPVKVMVISDTHLWINDERGDPYRQYSDRMAGAYNKTTHFQSGELTNPTESFEKTLQLAVDSKVDLIALVGDIFSWPSEAAIEWAFNKIQQAGVPYIYVAGNHDWHYEGMEGTSETLRETWINKRLLSLYQGRNPMMAAYDIKGIRFLAIDNSTYQISAQQLDFFIDQVKSKMPLILLMYIPMYAPGRSIGFGCGHPEWGAKTDNVYEIERRPKWPVNGHTPTTMNFYKEVFTAPNLLGVFAGHIHEQSVEYINGIHQFVADDNASGGFLDVSLNPLLDWHLIDY